MAKKKDEAAKPEAAKKEKKAPKPEPEVEAEKQQAPTAPKKKKRPGSSPPRGKKSKKQIQAQRKKLKKEGATDLTRALTLLKQQKRAKFDETVEVHMLLGVDTTQSDQMLRGTVSLPHGIGKSVRILVFCQGENEDKAKEAGADYVGSDDLVKKIQDGWTDFDIALATQDMMGKVGRLGKVLGPRGLMPTPKAGTVVTPGMDLGNVIQEFKAGKVEYRTDKGGNVHAGVGKLSFDDDKLAENIMTFVNQIRTVKPSGVKGHYIKSVSICSTMSPSIPVTV